MTTESSNDGATRTALEAAKLNGGDDSCAGKVYVITGAYSGIGVETTKAVLACGAGKVVVTGRNQKLIDEFVETLKKDYDADKIDGGCLVDLGDLASVKAFAKYVNSNYPSIDVLINNAGIMNTPPGITTQGFEQQMGVNVIGHFLLTKALAEKTKRQIWVSSEGHKYGDAPRIDIDYIKNFNMNDTKDYNCFLAYQQSKLGNILLAKEFHNRYPNIETASLHPGVIMTNLSRNMTLFQMIPFMLFRVIPRLITGEIKFKSIEAGAATTVHTSALSSSDLVNGGYYLDCDVATEADSAKNEEDAKTLFDYCDRVTKEYQ